MTFVAAGSLSLHQFLKLKAFMLGKLADLVLEVVCISLMTSQVGQVSFSKVMDSREAGKMY